MIIWPHSATLSEVGGTAGASGSFGAPGGGAGGPGMGGPGMGGPGMKGQGGGMIGVLQALNQGEIMLNRAESAALAALETEDDPAHGMRRARAESGLDQSQLARLKRRADTAVRKGYTLKGQGFIKKPTPGAAPDEPGLTKKAQRKGEDTDENPAPKEAEVTATKKVTAKAKPAKEAGALLVRTYEDDLYTVKDVPEYGYPTPASDGQPVSSEMGPSKEANTMTTLASMLRRNRRKKMPNY